MKGRTFQLEVKGPWGGKELGNLWELKEPWRKEDGLVIVLERKTLLIGSCDYEGRVSKSAGSPGKPVV